MNTVIQNQRKERDELLARPYLVRKSNTNASVLLANPMIKLITGPRRVGKSTYALLMLQGRNFAYLNFDDNLLLSGWDDSPESRYSAPSITTVSPDKAAIARKAVASLLALINDADAPQGSQIAGHELLIRESTTRNPFPR